MADDALWKGADWAKLGGQGTTPTHHVLLGVIWPGVSMMAPKEPSANVLFTNRSCACVIRTLQEASKGQKKCNGTLHESCVRVGQKGSIFLPIRFETYLMV